MSYIRVRKQAQRQALDRGTWSDTAQLILVRETEGSGDLVTEPVDFGMAFEGEPLFTWGVELVEGQELVPGDFPFVNVGIQDWVTTEDSVESENLSAALPVITGATIYFSVISGTQYHLRYRLSFEGMSFKNVEYIREG